jgi:hypothetical protein
MAIAAVLLTAAIALPAQADDFGAHPDLRAIRGGAPILLGHYLDTPVVVDDVVVEGDAALATWHSAGKPGIATYKRRSDRWWLLATYNTFSPATGVTVTQLEHTLAVPAALIERAQAHIPGLLTSLPIERPVEQRACAACPSMLWNYTDGFQTTLAFDAGTKWDPTFALRGRAASIAEMPPTPTMNKYYFFRLSAKGAEPIVIRNGASLDIWFPYVLDASKSYDLWLDFIDPDADGLPGTLKDNTLHFTLPAFSTIPGKDAFGEIDGA